MNTENNNIFVFSNSYKDSLEIQLLDINADLSQEDLDSNLEHIGLLFYRRAVTHDSLGLRLLASIDFHESIDRGFAVSDSYNYLGIYYAQDEMYDQASESFDLAIQNNPNNKSAYLNKSLSSYYNKKYLSSYDNMLIFYKLKNKSITSHEMLWFYIATKNIDKDFAESELKKHQDTLTDKDYFYGLIDLLLNKNLSESEYIEKYVYKDNFLESISLFYFYKGKSLQDQGRYRESIYYFNKSLKTSTNYLLEHKYSNLEISRSLKFLNN